jgi:hypothetical protein
MPPGAAGLQHTHRGMTGERAEIANDDQEEVYFRFRRQSVSPAWLTCV